HFLTLLKRLKEKPRRIIYFTGPRQSGKTTLVSQSLNNQPWPFQFVSTDEPDTSEYIFNPAFENRTPN
ncbi:MAG: hypothetical protein OXE95_14230, partial [Chloroflexi bacterium]|nr:hypothetical protein [Chloroflexota bacterium]